MDTSALAASIMSMNTASLRANVQTSVLRQQFDMQKQTVDKLLPTPQPASGTGHLVDKTV